MASAAASLEDLVTCSVCLDPFSNPHLLLCLHTFCHKCVLAISNQHPNQKITCPTCRAETELGQIKQDFKTVQVMDVHLHLYMSSQRQKVESMGRDIGNPPDDICQLCDWNVASDACRKCNGIFCVICLKAHRKFSRCLEEDVESIDERSRYCVEGLQKLQKLVLGNTTDLQKQLDEKSVQSQQEQNKVKNDLDEFFARIVDEVDNLADQHMKKLEVQHTEKFKKMNDLNGLLSVTMRKSKAGVVKAFGSVSNQVQDELAEHGHLVCPPLKIAVNNPCLNDQRVHVSVSSSSDQISLVDLVDKNLSVTRALHLTKSDIRRIKIIHGNIWCVYKDEMVIFNSLGESIATINLPLVVDVHTSDLDEIIAFSFCGIYKIDDCHEIKITCLSKEPFQYLDVWIGGGHCYAVHVNNGKLCLDEMNEEYRLVRHRRTVVDAPNDRVCMNLIILNGTAFISSVRFNSFFQIDLSSGRIMKEFNYRVKYPMFTDGRHLLVSQPYGLCLFQPDEGRMTPLKLPPAILRPCYGAGVTGKKLAVMFYDIQLKYWLLAVLSY